MPKAAAYSPFRAEKKARNHPGHVEHRNENVRSSHINDKEIYRRSHFTVLQNDGEDKGVSD